MGWDATTWASVWVFISLILFLALMVYFGLPKMIAKSLDDKIAKIGNDLDEAKRLREEAQALLAEYERKRKDAESEAADIITAAQEEAERIAEEANASLEDLISRRTKAVEDKIAQAEAQAIGEVRARSADVAVEAARAILADQMTAKGDALVDQAIKDVAAKLN
ncbi:F0F1 ATP synthase subunit B family protein [Mariluticola halotolerans]|uniref:F0F1 ATP synthase subunit B family protein n=1 Tax=Mariluticola halotolerans TaxID=2909283 RepID=UPI0026E400F4|nr:ATP F0F1 synthase subunit B [Mariluticola halotolerans]UJQ95836.1 ATP F0F1 synthase subunit B [Mariluticola halotolerans]